jgi:hypothetical protein
MVLDAFKHMKGDSQMKNILLRAVSISFLAAILMFGTSMRISEAAAAPPAPAPSQVVMFSCAGDMGGILVVQAASSSVGAPSVSAGSSCSQALQDVLTAGFKIVESSFGSGFFGYMLQK